MPLDLVNDAPASHAVSPQAPTAPSVEDLRAIVTAQFKKIGSAHLKTLREVEFMPLAHLRAAETAGTVLDIPTQALNGAGMKVDGTVGAVMDALSLTQDDIDQAFCYCVNGDAITGDMAAARFAKFV